MDWESITFTRSESARMAKAHGSLAGDAADTATIGAVCTLIGSPILGVACSVVFEIYKHKILGVFETAVARHQGVRWKVYDAPLVTCLAVGLDCGDVIRYKYVSD